MRPTTVHRDEINNLYLYGSEFPGAYGRSAAYDGA
jgi:hypothetical protein